LSRGQPSPPDWSRQTWPLLKIHQFEHELSELSDQIHNLLFLSGGDCTKAQLEDYAEQLTHVLRYGRALGFHAAFLWENGGIVIEWQSLQAGGQ
jgi:hypothetical protein